MRYVQRLISSPPKPLRPLPSSLPPSSDFGFLCLPNELLLLIFEDLRTSDLYRLSQVSRRLHYIALPIYLAHYGIREPSPADSSYEATICYDGISALRGLRLALFVTSLDSFDVSFNSEEEIAPMLCELGRLVSKLRCISHLRLDFGQVIQDVLDDETREGREAMQAMQALAATLARKSCKTLAVSQSCFIDIPRDIYHAAALRPMSPFDPRRVHFSLKRLFHRPVGSVLYPLTTLEYVNISAPGMFFPSLFDWTINSLNASLLTHLALSPILTPRSWHLILSRLLLPALENFSLSSHGLALADFSSFLTRHPKITALSLRFTPLGTFVHPLPPLEYLKELDACPEVLSLILESGVAIPHLQNIAIIPPSSLFSGRNFAPVDRVLSALACLSTHRIRLRLTLLGNTDSAVWLQSKYTLSHLCVCVRWLRLETWGEQPLSTCTASILSRWLSTLFPHLSCLQFGRDTLPELMTRQEKAEFVTRVAGVCKELEVMGIEHATGALEEHKICAWIGKR